MWYHHLGGDQKPRGRKL